MCWTLAPGLVVPTPYRVAAQTASASTPARADFELPWWRVDVANVAPGANNLAVEVYDGATGARRSATASVTPQGDVDFPAIPLGDRLHPQLLKLLGSDGLTCTLEETSGVLTREPAGSTRQAVTDEIPWRVGTPDRPDTAGWIEVTPEPVSQARPGGLRLAVHGLPRLLARVGAGVFSGTLGLRVRNPRLQGGEELRLSQSVALVIAGSRVVSAGFESRGAKAIPIGARTAARVELESVQLVRPDTPDEMNPGWWLQVQQADRSGGEAVLCRVPLPFKEGSAVGPGVFRVGEGTGDLAWDTVDTPPGYYRDGTWKDQVIVQHVERGNDLAERRDVRVRRYTVTTYVPLCAAPGTLGGGVTWDPSATDKPVPRHADAAPANAATGRSLGPLEIRSGLLASTDRPLTGETFWVWAVLDFKAIPGAEALAEHPPDELTVALWKEDPGTAEWRPFHLVPLRRRSNAAEPNVERYRSDFHFQAGETGRYRLKLYTGQGPAPEGEVATAPPRELVDGLAAVEVPLHVSVEGHDEAAPAYGLEFPLKVFTDREPFWWVSGEPGFASPYENERDPEPGHYQVTSNRAVSFHWPSAQGDRKTRVRYQGLFQGTAPEPAEPGAEADPVVVDLRYDGTQASIPHLTLVARPEDRSERVAVPDGESADLTEGPSVPRRFYDLHVDLEAAARAAPGQGGWGVAPHAVLARFVITGVDGEGRPFGRAYVRPFQVSVRSMRDEVAWESVGLGAGLSGVVGYVLYRRRARQKRKLKAAAATAAADAARAHVESSAAREHDYFSGLDSAPPDAGGSTADDPGAAPRTPPAPRDPPPAPTSYLDDLGPEGGGSGTSYLDP